MVTKQQVGIVGGTEYRFPTMVGMDAEAKVALAELERLAAGGRVTVPGIFMPDAWVRARLRRLGVIEDGQVGDCPRRKTMAVPYGGMSAGEKRRWKEAGWKVVETGAAGVRRAQVALGLLKMEGARTLVIGRHDDPETRALAADHAGTLVLEDTTDIARMRYEPSFGAVCQTTLSPRRVAWLGQQLRLRYRDSRMTVLNTVAPGMAAREQALESLAGWCDGVLVIGDEGEASVEALLEAARRLGKQAAVVVDQDGVSSLEGCRKIAVTAGGFAPPERIAAVAGFLGAGR